MRPWVLGAAYAEEEHKPFAIGDDIAERLYFVAREQGCPANNNISHGSQEAFRAPN
jgi:hypothetical protein